MRVSVVVPTYNRSDLLNRCLAALLAQDFDAADFEIVVADDAASEETRQIVDWWMALPAAGAGGGRECPEIRYVPVIGSHGPAAARNTGWRAAKGQIIAFTDDDCVPDAHWLREGVARFDDGVSAVQGKIVMPLPDNPTDYQLDASHLQESDFVTANCLLLREILESTGGFDERFRLAWREDSDLYFRLLERSIRVVRCGKAIVVHPLRYAHWGASIGQQRKSMYNALLYKKHPKLYRDRVQSSPPIHYYVIALSLMAALACALAGAPHGALLFVGLWLALTVRFSIRRLWNTSHALVHVLEMLFTSMVIPPTALYWRLRGAIKFRVLFL